MLPLLRLIRLPNLFIIALTMCGVRYGLLEPLWRRVAEDLTDQGFIFLNIGMLHMNGFEFGLLLTSTLLIAAAGYIINDYFDTKADRINRPERVVVGRSIPRRGAMVLHFVLNPIALVLAFYLCYRAGHWQLISIQLFSIIALWFYSTHLKKQLLSGNILIAFLAALVPITTGVFEFISDSFFTIEKINRYLPGRGNRLLTTGAFLVVGYSLFAFLSNLIREIIKDTEDMEGDAAHGCRTLPVVIGEKATRYISMCLTLLMIILLALVQQILFMHHFTILFWYILAAVQLPLAVLLAILWNAAQKSDYSRASLVCKILVITGVLSMFVFRWTY